MSHVLLLGVAPLPVYRQCDRLSAPGLETWQHLRALVGAGHSIDLVTFSFGTHDPAPDCQPALHELGQVRHLPLPEATPDNRAQLTTQVLSFIDRTPPDAFISLGSPVCSFVATQLPIGVPCWFDLFGHFLGEVQAALPGKDYPALHLLLLDHYRQILTRGDKFSATSDRARLATLGELGLMGRLNAATLGYDFVETIRSGVDVSVLPQVESGFLRGARCPEDAFIALWTSGINAWADITTLAEAVREAVQEHPGFHFVMTGAGIAGHHEDGFEQLRQALGPHLDRQVHLPGWLSREQVFACYRDADIGLLIDLPIVESHLGSRTRLPEWMAAGLPIVTTTNTEICADLVDRELAIGLPTGDSSAIAAIIGQLVTNRGGLQDLSQRAGAHARQDLRHELLDQPLLEWLECPTFAPDRQAADRQLEVIKDHVERTGRLTTLELDVLHGGSARRLGKVDKLLGR